MMKSLSDLMLRFKGDRRGVSAIEYGLLAALVGVAITAAATTLGTKLAGLFTAIGNSL